MSTEIEREKTFNLALPVTDKGEELAVLTVKRPTMRIVGEFEASKKGVIDGMIDVVAKCSGKPPALIGDIDPMDFKPISQWLGEVMGKSATE